jgi:hypothetical protein
MGKGGQKPAAGAAEMKAARKLYEAGDVFLARKEAERVLQAGGSEADKTEAADLLERTRFPKMGLMLAALAATLILLMVTLAVIRNHG